MKFLEEMSAGANHRQSSSIKIAQGPGLEQYSEILARLERTNKQDIGSLKLEFRSHLLDVLGSAGRKHGSTPLAMTCNTFCIYSRQPDNPVLGKVGNGNNRPDFANQSRQQSVIPKRKLPLKPLGMIQAAAS